MPSGSHSGSSGSHFSGGSSHGTSSSRARISRSRTRYIFIGGVRTPIPARFIWISVLSSFLFVLVFFGVMFGTIFTIAMNSNLNTIKADYQYYQAMVERAEKNPDYKKQGYISDIVRSDNCGKYYLEYYLYTNNGEKLEGYTFSVYTLEETLDFEIGQTVDIAVNSIPVITSTDSITMDFKNKTLQDDGEYLQTLRTRQHCFIAFYVAGAFVLGIIILNVVLHIKTKKECEKSTTKTVPKGENLPNLSPEPTKQNLPKSTEVYAHCPNCGGDITADQKTCPVCGEKLVKRKKRI